MSDRPRAVAGMVWLPLTSAASRWTSAAAIERIAPGAQYDGGDDSWCYVDGARVEVSASTMLEVLAEAWAQRGALGR